jgi:hypothetical protein
MAAEGSGFFIKIQKPVFVFCNFLPNFKAIGGAPYISGCGVRRRIFSPKQLSFSNVQEKSYNAFYVLGTPKMPKF